MNLAYDSLLCMHFLFFFFLFEKKTIKFKKKKVDSYKLLAPGAWIGWLGAAGRRVQVARLPLAVAKISGIA